MPSSDVKTAIIFAFPARGGFVVGNTTAAAATLSTVVTHWGSEWSIRNVLTGGVAPYSFKGFAGTPSTNPPVFKMDPALMKRYGLQPRPSP